MGQPRYRGTYSQQSLPFLQFWDHVNSQVPDKKDLGLAERRCSAGCWRPCTGPGLSTPWKQRFSDAGTFDAEKRTRFLPETIQGGVFLWYWWNEAVLGFDSLISIKMMIRQGAVARAEG